MLSSVPRPPLMPRIATRGAVLAAALGWFAPPLAAQDPTPAPTVTDTVPVPAVAVPPVLPVALPAGVDSAAADSLLADAVVTRADSADAAAVDEDDSVVRGIALPGGLEEERLRMAQLAGVAPATGFLLRSASTLVPRRAGTAYLALLGPRMELGWNSSIPWSANDGPLRGGKGAQTRVLAGFEAAVGPLRLFLAPELVWEQNEEFDSLLPVAWDSAQRQTFTAPWQTGIHAVDLPWRFGDEGRTAFLPGESSLTLRAGPVEAGVATESQWWGPGIRSALLLSSNAGGFPHALFRTAKPVSTPLGALEWRWIIGELSSSDFDTASVGRTRSLSAASLVLSPTANLSIGAARVVYQPSDGRAPLEDVADVFTRFGGAGDTTRAQPFEQMVSLFARWVLPGDGTELYGEWGRRRLAGLRELLETPEHSQGYTVGFVTARPLGDRRVRISGEATYLEKDPTYRAEPPASWYAGAAVPQGYTHRGQALGSFVGPGASGQWLAVDYVAPRAQAGVSFTRVRWANDALYDNLPIGRYRAHDVSVLGSLRGALVFGGAWIDAEWTLGRRYNFLFQNFSRDFTERELSVSPFNHSLRLRISAAPPSLPF